MNFIKRIIKAKKEGRRQERIAKRVNRWMTRREAVRKELGYEEV